MAVGRGWGVIQMLNMMESSSLGRMLAQRKKGEDSSMKGPRLFNPSASSRFWPWKDGRRRAKTKHLRPICLLSVVCASVHRACLIGGSCSSPDGNGQTGTKQEAR